MQTMEQICLAPNPNDNECNFSKLSYASDKTYRDQFVSVLDPIMHSIVCNIVVKRVVMYFCLFFAYTGIK
jgi:hypothetical protein